MKDAGRHLESQLLGGRVEQWTRVVFESAIALHIRPMAVLMGGAHSSISATSAEQLVEMMQRWKDSSSREIGHIMDKLEE